MSLAVRALRGATTVDRDETEHLYERVIALLEALFEHNPIHHDDLISVLFTATTTSTAPSPPPRPASSGWATSR